MVKKFAKGHPKSAHADKVGKVMHEYKHGNLRSGSGSKVTSRDQALAIALTEQRAAKNKKKGGKMSRGSRGGKKK